MADHDHNHHHHHHQHRPHRLSLPQRPTTPTTFAATPTAFPTTPTTSRQYPVYPFSSSSTPIATPSKHRLSSLNPKPFNPNNNSKSSLSFLFFLLLSLRSLYSLLPFLRSSPSFSLFPFSFLVSLLSFLLTLSCSLFTSSSSSSSKDPFHQKQNQPIFSFTLITQSQHRLLVAKSILLAVVFLLRFQALRYCGTAAMILAELSGNVAARFLAEGRDSNLGGDRNRSSKVRGFLALFSGLLLLSLSWDRIECFPFSAKSVESLGLSVFPRVDCVRIWPMLLPFLSGFLGCYERVSMNWGTIRQLGRKRVRLISLFFTTVVLFIPAVVSVFMFEAEGDGVSIGNLAWPLANTVVFGVLLSESYGDDKSVSSKDFRKEYLVTFLCTLVLELFYFPELSLWGLLLCGLLLYVAVRELDPYYSNYLELGMESSESFTTAIMKPIRHILSERKSRKIALFLLINTAYMFVEFAAGFMSNSLGLISDACHMLFDCAALAIGLYASYISRLPANHQFNYGRGRFEVLSGYTNAVFLVLVGALIVLESFERILDPQEISTSSLLVVSIGGLLVNVVGLVFFHEEHHHAHGGSGSCSHSHHHQHSHDSVGHDHGGHGKHEESIPISIECHENSCSGHDDHHEHQHGSYICSKDHNFGSNECHDHDGHSHQHDHRGQSHQHDHRGQSHQHDHHGHSHQHGHHGQSHQHDHHGQSHQHDQHDHDCQHEHHDHACQHKHHDHAHQHDQHDHDRQHEHHDHACQHKHHDHAHQHTHSSEGNKAVESHIQGAGFQLKKLPTDGEKTAKHQHHHIDHNMEGIFLHVLADTLGSVGVVISTLLIKYKGWLVADPACSIFISVLIISSVIPLLRNSAEILLQRVPRAHEQDLRKALIDVRKIRGISGIQNLHIWSFTNSEVVGTLHLHVSTDIDKASAKAQVSHVLYEAGIKDLTLQLECVEQ
ncbi:putative zinc transporter protein [Prunus yedoensis var. nudiflora]|uniref:Putative zinc transporter protein n=1 Tax=Prunus yedoensis var. nudiflora TaxID=2094558 RepID=A0A314UD34_PRUYE|nr:putative zinc transporter protein [Prunus yedoensis var. nudiflora]